LRRLKAITERHEEQISFTETGELFHTDFHSYVENSFMVKVKL
jgi:hypothetical protein